MTLQAFREALDQLPEPTCCEGTGPITERFAIALPDGDLGAIDDPKFVSWLLAHSEVAPYGQGGKTKVDAKVREAHRLTARGAVTIAGFDPASVMGEIEAALSPREHLDAKLTDVLVYSAGGHFARHKDTPRDAELVGTLVVGLPIAHEGGQFEIAERDSPRLIDWSGRGTPGPRHARWVALFGDVDHEVKPVTSGSRVTLVYALSRSKRPRADAARGVRMARLRELAQAITVPEAGPLMIACSRQVIAETTTKDALQSVDALRGFDREIAEVLVESGFDVAVRPCILATPTESTGLRGEVYSIARLRKVLSPGAVAEFDHVVTFGESADCDGEDMSDDATCLAPYILDRVPIERWVIRHAARATLLHEAAMFSDDGYFGNEGYEAHIYTLAALEVTRAPTKKTGMAIPASNPPAKRPAVKQPVKTAVKKPVKKPAKKPKRR